MDTERGFTIKDLLIRLILIIVFIFLLIWLFPMPDLKPLNNQIFADNIGRMRDVAKSYYTVERLPKNINDSKKMTLREMIDNKLILPLMDSNGKYCSENNSYIQITKLENEYVIKVYLSCSDKQDYIIEHFGCYDICSDKCKELATTTTTTTTTYYKKNPTTKKITKKTTLATRVTTTKGAKLYEYEYTRNVCNNVFDKYTCPSGYYLTGDKCVKQGSSVVSVDAKTKVDKVTSTDTKDAIAVVTNNDTKVDATKSTKTVYSTIDATQKSNISSEVLLKTQLVTADKTYSYDVKGAVGTQKTVTASYNTVQNYDVITATKYATSAKWEYVSTRYSYNGSESFTNDTEKLLLVDSWQELTCDTCFTTVTVYKYYRYKKVVTGYSYSCDAFPGYTLYDTNKCRKPTTVTKTCPSGYTDTGSNCKKVTVTYSCSSYGSDYKYDENKKTCTKTITNYSCPKGTEKTADPKVCSKKVYGCPSGTTSIGNGKCSKISYSCPANTTDKTYTLVGTKCSVKTIKTVYSCPVGTVETNDEKYCIKKSSSIKYTCNGYNGYTLVDKKCVKTTVTDKITYYCESGYTLNGTKCLKTVNTTDMKNAEKTYKVSCNPEYKWSTKPSLDGWNYTGNKRLIN